MVSGLDYLSCAFNHLSNGRNVIHKHSFKMDLIPPQPPHDKTEKDGAGGWRGA